MAERARGMVINSPELDSYQFYVALTSSFRPLGGIGHFGFVDADQYDFIINNEHAWQRWLYSPSAIARLYEPQVVSFYNRYRDRFMPGAPPSGGIPTTNILTTSIEEGRISHLRVGSFWWMNVHGSEYDNEMLNFFNDIRGYEHLIIDLRNTGGGCASNFTISIMAPNIEQSVRVEGFVFLTQGGYAAGYYDRALAGGSVNAPQFQSRMYSTDTELRPIDEMFKEFDLTEFNMADAERLDYGFRMHMDVVARHLPRFDSQPAFDGKIWFLTGPNMGSAIQLSSWVAKESGFATLVGEITGGVYGGPRTFVALPNSGIVFNMDVFYVTDSHGRPLEAGTIPHYFNREGMDALETVLAMIEEGQY
jgi:hypothetical protein